MFETARKHDLHPPPSVMSKRKRYTPKHDVANTAVKVGDALRRDKRLTEKMPHIVCMSSGTRPDSIPRPVFRMLPYQGRCDELLQREGGCCIRDFDFANNVAKIVRSADPGVSRRPVTLQMLAWIDALYVNFAAPTQHLILDMEDPDGKLLIDFAIEMRANTGLGILVTGQDVELNDDLHEYQGTVLVQGVDANSSVTEQSILNIAYFPSSISQLFVVDCLLTYPFQSDADTFVGALLVLVEADGIETLRLTLPPHVTFNDVQGPFLDSNWTVTGAYNPVYMLHHADHLIDVRMEFNFGESYVTCEVSRP